MNFINMFNLIDSDHSGEITKSELISFMHANNFTDKFVDNWLTLFDFNRRGRITIDDYCERLGLEIDENMHKNLKKHRPSQLNLEDLDDFVNIDNKMKQHVIHVSTSKPLSTPVKAFDDDVFIYDNVDELNQKYIDNKNIPIDKQTDNDTSISNENVGNNVRKKTLPFFGSPSGKRDNRKYKTISEYKDSFETIPIIRSLNPSLSLPRYANWDPASERSLDSKRKRKSKRRSKTAEIPYPVSPLSHIFHNINFRRSSSDFIPPMSENKMYVQSKNEIHQIDASNIPKDKSSSDIKEFIKLEHGKSNLTDENEYLDETITEDIIKLSTVAGLKSEQVCFDEVIDKEKLNQKDNTLKYESKVPILITNTDIKKDYINHKKQIISGNDSLTNDNKIFVDNIVIDYKNSKNLYNSKVIEESITDSPKRFKDYKKYEENENENQIKTVNNKDTNSNIVDKHDSMLSDSKMDIKINSPKYFASITDELYAYKTKSPDKNKYIFDKELRDNDLRGIENTVSNDRNEDSKITENLIMEQDKNTLLQMPNNENYLKNISNKDLLKNDNEPYEADFMNGYPHSNAGSSSNLTNSNNNYNNNRNQMLKDLVSDNKLSTNVFEDLPYSFVEEKNLELENSDLNINNYTNKDLDYEDFQRTGNDYKNTYQTNLGIAKNDDKDWDKAIGNNEQYLTNSINKDDNKEMNEAYLDIHNYNDIILRKDKSDINKFNVKDIDKINTSILKYDEEELVGKNLDIHRYGDKDREKTKSSIHNYGDKDMDKIDSDIHSYIYKVEDKNKLDDHEYDVNDIHKTNSNIHNNDKERSKSDLDNHGKDDKDKDKDDLIGSKYGNKELNQTPLDNYGYVNKDSHKPKSKTNNYDNDGINNKKFNVSSYEDETSKKTNITNFFKNPEIQVDKSNEYRDSNIGKYGNKNMGQNNSHLHNYGDHDKIYSNIKQSEDGKGDDEIKDRISPTKSLLSYNKMEYSQFFDKNNLKIGNKVEQKLDNLFKVERDNEQNKTDINGYKRVEILHKDIKESILSDLLKGIVNIYENYLNNFHLNCTEFMKRFLDYYYDISWNVIITEDEYQLYFTYEQMIIFQYDNLIFILWKNIIPGALQNE